MPPAGYTQSPFPLFTWHENGNGDATQASCGKTDFSIWCSWWGLGNSIILSPDVKGRREGRRRSLDIKQSVTWAWQTPVKVWAIPHPLSQAERKTGPSDASQVAGGLGTAEFWTMLPPSRKENIANFVSHFGKQKHPTGSESHHKPTITQRKEGRELFSLLHKASVYLSIHDTQSDIMANALPFPQKEDHW